jgi:hypothetical protein
MKFDINAARKAGYSDDEIAQFLAEQNKFDLGGALSSGYSSSDVIDFLAKPVADAGGGRGFINPPMAGQPQPTYPKLRPAPAPATDYSDMATAMQGTPMSRPQPAAPAPAPAKPPPYKNRLEALDDAVNLVEEGADFKKVAQAFSQIGIGEGDIMSHGKARKSPMFDLPEMSRKQIDQYVKPQPQQDQRG